MYLTEEFVFVVYIDILSIYLTKLKFIKSRNNDNILSISKSIPTFESKK